MNPGKLEIENVPEGWVTTNTANDENSWYAYKDPDGNIAEVNEPKLASGMKAIKYETENSELVEGSQWANAMTKDGSMWVWIPRYAYRITSGYHKNATEIGGTGAGTIEIAFLKGSTNEFLDSSITGTVVTGGVTEETYADDTKWILEPGFEFGGEHLTGFWFAKFEASNTEEKGEDLSANRTTLTLQIKPNKRSWTAISSANMFQVCQNLTSSSNYKTYFNNVSNVDTHMTKNIEWGTVAYLTHSKFGLNGEEVGINNYNGYKTGIGSDSPDSGTSDDASNEYNTEIGIKASTTKNLYGIYDMSGGTFEYVAACLIGYTSKITSNTNETYINKYIDVYNAFNHEGYKSSKYGDAIFEISNTTGLFDHYKSWFKDDSAFTYPDHPLFTRGGSCKSGEAAGIFFFGSSEVHAYNYTGFRPVCIVK